MSAVRLSDVVAAMDQRYPQTSAAPWDSVGLVVGDPEATVSKVLCVVDVTRETVAQAISLDVQLIIAHHPLLLRGVHSVAQTSVKGELITNLIRNNIALFTAHTNADGAWPGVSDALAQTLGGIVREGVVLEVETQIGRIADLPELTTATKFANRIAEALPHSSSPIQVSGNLDKVIQSFAVCGGAGDSLLETVAAMNVDAYLTSDLRHHVAGEFTATHDCVLINVSHWAGEWPWLNLVAQELRQEFADKVEVVVSEIATDPWTMTIARS